MRSDFEAKSLKVANEKLNKALSLALKEQAGKDVSEKKSVEDSTLWLKFLGLFK